MLLGNQRTSGPENDYMTPGPMIYLNDFINDYLSRAISDKPLVKHCGVNRYPLHVPLCLFVSSSKFQNIQIHQII